MARVYGILGTQQYPTAGVLTDAYTVPASKHATAKVMVSNHSSDDTFRVALSPNGAAVSNEHYIAFDQPILANQSAASVGFTIGAGTVVRVSCAGGSCSFSVDGIEDDN